MFACCVYLCIFELVPTRVCYSKRVHVGILWLLFFQGLPINQDLPVVTTPSEYSPSEYSQIAGTSGVNLVADSTPSVCLTPDCETIISTQVEHSRKETSDIGLNSETNSETNNLNSNCEYAKPNKHIEVQESVAGRCNTEELDEDQENKLSGERQDEATSLSPTKSESGVVDNVYQHTTSVVKSVIELNTGVHHAQPEEFIDLVKVSFILDVTCDKCDFP